MNATIRKQIKALEKLRLPELQARFAEVTGEETRAPNRTFLIRKITEALEARAADAPEAEAAQTQPEAPSPDEAAAAPATDEATPAPPDTAPDDEAVEPAPQTETDNSDGEETKLTKLSVPELQALYLEAVGRSTGSSHKRYLVWKIRQAQRGRIPVGPRGQRRADGEAVDFKVLPLRMEAELVAQLDEARERLGLKSRMELFRRSLHAYLLEAGEVRVAEMFAAEA